LRGVLEWLEHGFIAGKGVLFELTIDVVFGPGGEGHSLSLGYTLAVLTGATNSLEDGVVEFPLGKVNLDQERNVDDGAESQGDEEESYEALRSFNLHVLPSNITWINWSLQFEICDLLANYFSL